MLPSRLFGTTAFRMTLVYMALFAASVSGLSAYVYWNTAGRLAHQTDQRIRAELAGLAEQYRLGGVGLLARQVTALAAADAGGIYLLRAGGTVLAGNLDAPPQAGGGSADAHAADAGAADWLEFTYHRPARSPPQTQAPQTQAQQDRAARAVEVRLPGGVRLLAGRDVTAQRTWERLLTRALGWSLLLTVGLGLAGGALVSRSVLARVDAISRTSRDIMAGDLAQRLPVSGSGDELDRLSVHLNAMLERMEQLIAGMRDISDNVAHDMRGPLARMRNRLDVTLLQDPGRAQYRAALEETITEAQALLNMFNALISIARLESGAARESIEDVDVARVLRDAVELYAPAAEARGMTLALRSPGALPARGNRELLARAVSNLLENAIRHGGAPPRQDGGTGGGRIEVSGAAGPHGVQITVADQGPGIAEADRARVMDRFVRLEASRNTPGSGLGLSLVRAIARLHSSELRGSELRGGELRGGELRLTAPPGGGPGLAASFVVPSAGCESPAGRLHGERNP